MPDWIRRFVESLSNLTGGGDASSRDSATLAHLRRGLTARCGARDIWVCAHFSGDDVNDVVWAELVASLFALWHQGDRVGTTPSSLGGSFRRLADEYRREAGLKPNDDVPAVERRFARLLDSHADDLPGRLRQAVMLLRSKDVPINWARLLDDLTRWSMPRRPVQRGWAQDYWTRFISDTDTASTHQAEEVNS